MKYLTFFIRILIILIIINSSILVLLPFLVPSFVSSYSANSVWGTLYLLSIKIKEVSIYYLIFVISSTLILYDYLFNKVIMLSAIEKKMETKEKDG